MTTNLALEFDGDTTYDSATTNLVAGTTIKPSATQVLSTGADIAYDSAYATSDDKAKIQAWHTDPVTGNVATTAAQANGQVVGYENIYNQWLSRSTKGLREDDVSSMPANRKTGENQKLGTYYNWYTATAGTGTSAAKTGFTAPADICPKGWQLARGSIDHDYGTQSVNGSWMYVIRTIYHLIVNQGDQSSVDQGNPEANNIVKSIPFSVPRSGYVDYIDGSTSNQGNIGISWSAFAGSNAYARDSLISGITNIRPSGADSRSFGFSIRCLAK